jgi:hypothetical protein
VSDPEDPAPENAEDRVDLTGLSRLSDRPPPPKGERAIRVVRVLSVLLLALAAAGLPWYFVTRSGTKEGSGGTSTPSRSPSATASPSPAATAANYEVFNVGTACLRIRSEPSTSAKLVTCLGPDVRVRADGRTQQVGSRLWRHVFYAPKKLTGWAAAEYLRPVP